MSDGLASVLRRFEERLVRLEFEVEAGARHWKAVHLHKALAALPGRSPRSRPAPSTSWTVPNSPGRIPKMAEAQVPTVEEIRSRFGHDRRRNALGCIV